MQAFFAMTFLSVFTHVITEWPDDYAYGVEGAYWGLIIPDEQLINSNWCDKKVDPPISIRKAVRIVNKHLKELRGKKEFEEWELFSVKLKSKEVPDTGTDNWVPRWYYVVVLRHNVTGTGSDIKFIAGVTMEGLLIEPTNLGQNLPKILQVPE